MALYKQVEFAEKCGISRAQLSVYKNRNKIIVDGGFVDDSKPINAEFMRKCLEKLKDKLTKEVTMVQNLDTPVQNQTQSTESKEKKQVKVDVDAPAESIYELDRIKKGLDIQKTAEEIEILKVKKDKLHGVVIPTELVKIVFTQHSKSIGSSFHNASETFLTMIGKKKGLNINEMAELRGELIEIINTAVAESIIESKKQIKNIVDEYSEKRGVGEREA